MEAQEFQELYNLMRGNADALVIMDARGLFLNGDPVGALEKVVSTHERYAEAKQRTLRIKVTEDDKGKSKEDAAKDKRLRKKQGKYREALDKFDEVIAALRPIAERAQAKQERVSAKTMLEEDAEARIDTTGSGSDTIEGSSPTEQTSAGDQSLTLEEFLVAYDGATKSSVRRDLVRQCFAVSGISDSEDIQTGDLYFIDAGKVSFLAIAGEITDAKRVGFTSAINGEKLKSASISSLLKLGKADKVWHLGVKGEEDQVEESASVAPDSSENAPPENDSPFFTDTSGLSEDDDDDDDDEVIVSSGLQESAATSRVLDKGAFSQLADAAQRTRICGGVDQISHVRDREFRRGDFQEALQIIENCYNKFMGSVSGRNARLRQEEQDLNSGRLKMSPRELQAKRVKDNAETQTIDRAISRFSRVLDGLRVLLRQQTDAEKAKSET